MPQYNQLQLTEKRDSQALDSAARARAPHLQHISVIQLKQWDESEQGHTNGASTTARSNQHEAEVTQSHLPPVYCSHSPGTSSACTHSRISSSGVLFSCSSRVRSSSNMKIVRTLRYKGQVSRTHTDAPRACVSLPLGNVLCSVRALFLKSHRVA